MLVTEAPNDVSTTKAPGPEAADWGGLLSRADEFARRHIGPSADETRQMLGLLGYSSLETLVEEAVPKSIRLGRPLQIPAGRSEFEVLAALKEIAAQNQVFRSCI